MKRLLTVLLAGLLLSFSAVAQTDFDKLESKLLEYACTLDLEPEDVRNAECDMLIESAKDSLVRQFVALKLYELYADPRVMGTESTAVYLVDKWFSTGKVKMHSDFELFNAEIFADFNRQSLLGCPAPPVVMEDSYGARVSLFENGGTGRYAVLYFYDTDCITCKMMSPRVTRILDGRKESLDIYPVYTGSDYDAWMRYIASHFFSEKYHNLWDPKFDSGFQEKYGVLSTPKLFLVAPDGTILGRGLDATALETLLDRLAVLSSDLHPAGDRPAVEDTVPDILYNNGVNTNAHAGTDVTGTSATATNNNSNACHCGTPNCCCNH